MAENSTINIVNVVVGILLSDTGKILIAKRNEGQHLGGYWEFPGGKQEQDESALQALERELQEELGIAIVDSRPLMQSLHDYSDRQVRLDFWLVESFVGTPRNLASQSVIWVDIPSLKDYKFPEANKDVVALLTSNDF